MALSKSKPKLLSFMALFVMMLLANKAHSQDTVSFQANSFNPNPMSLTYQGDAHVPFGSSLLRLTKTDTSGTVPRRWSVGRVLFSCPVQFWERSTGRQASFETTIRFLIKPSVNGAADGIAFFIAPVNSTIPQNSSGENLGIFGSSGASSSLFAVEFDTYVNPEVDPSFRHIGININSIESRDFVRFDNAVGQVVTARITYEPHTRTISVVTTTASRTLVLTYVFDLKTVLTDWVQVGISASTGRPVDVLGVHEIHSWHFTSTLVYA